MKKNSKVFLASFVLAVGFSALFTSCSNLSPRQEASVSFSFSQNVFRSLQEHTPNQSENDEVTLFVGLYNANNEQLGSYEETKTAKKWQDSLASQIRVSFSGIAAGTQATVTAIFTDAQGSVIASGASDPFLVSRGTNAISLQLSYMLNASGTLSFGIRTMSISYNMTPSDSGGNIKGTFTVQDEDGTDLTSKATWTYDLRYQGHSVSKEYYSVSGNTITITRPPYTGLYQLYVQAAVSDYETASSIINLNY